MASFGLSGALNSQYTADQARNALAKLQNDLATLQKVVNPSDKELQTMRKISDDIKDLKSKTLTLIPPNTPPPVTQLPLQPNPVLSNPAIPIIAAAAAAAGAEPQANLRHTNPIMKTQLNTRAGMRTRHNAIKSKGKGATQAAKVVNRRKPMSEATKEKIRAAWRAKKEGKTLVKKFKGWEQYEKIPYTPKSELDRWRREMGFESTETPAERRARMAMRAKWGYGVV